MLQEELNFFQIDAEIENEEPSLCLRLQKISSQSGVINKHLRQLCKTLLEFVTPELEKQATKKSILIVRLERDSTKMQHHGSDLVYCNYSICEYLEGTGTSFSEKEQQTKFLECLESMTGLNCAFNFYIAENGTVFTYLRLRW